MEEHNWKLYRKFQRIEERETLWESYMLDDAEMVVIAYGTAARIARGAINRLRREDANLRVGLIRPITCQPFSDQGNPGGCEENERFFCV